MTEQLDRADRLTPAANRSTAALLIVFLMLYPFVVLSFLFRRNNRFAKNADY